jgi:hypothetical protein
MKNSKHLSALKVSAFTLAVSVVGVVTAFLLASTFATPARAEQDTIFRWSDGRTTGTAARSGNQTPIAIARAAPSVRARPTARAPRRFVTVAAT